jgi:DNA-binding LacI/PurR family transcriptional regulator
VITTVLGIRGKQNGARKPTATIEDIARKTGLSTMTVSRALSNKGYCSKRSRSLIFAAAKKLDYQVNMPARQLRSNRTYQLGVITPFQGLLGTFYFGQILLGAHQALSGTDYNLALFDSESEDFNQGNKCVNLCRQRRVDGLIVVAPVRNDRFPLTFANLNMPLVVVGSSLRQKSISCVDVDNFGAATAIMEHLVHLGHKKIGFLGGPPTVRDAVERERAFRKTLAKYHLPVVESWILPGDYEIRKSFHLSLELLSRPDRPTAIFAANDPMAFGVIDAARVLNLRVPEDLSVAGFDDVEGAAECVPSLTTAAQPMRQLGQVAASHLLARLNGKSPPTALHQKLSAPLVIRGSTAPCPSKPPALDLGNISADTIRASRS